jgi:histidine ammonia-lyase
MGANGATKLWRVLRNTERVLGIAFLTAAQALDLQRPAVRTSPRLETLLARYRERVPVLEEDRWLQPDIEATVAFLREVEA